MILKKHNEPDTDTMLVRHFEHKNYIRIVSLNILKKLALIFGLLLVVTIVEAQRTASVTGNWNNTATWGGQSVPASSDAVTINSGVLVTVDVAAVAASITVNAPAANNGITISGSNMLTVTGAINMNSPSAGTFTASTGTVNCNGSSARTVGGYTYNVLKSNNTAGVTLLAASTITTLNIGDVTSGSIFNDGGFVITPGSVEFYRVGRRKSEDGSKKLRISDFGLSNFSFGLLTSVFLLRTSDFFVTTKLTNITSK